MNAQQAREILGDRAGWELRAMRRALSLFPILNTDAENKRLEAVKALLEAKQ